MVNLRQHYPLITLTIIISLYTFLRLWYITPMITQIGGYDEGVYAMGGKMISQGLLPYRDFVLLHPPLYDLVLGCLFKVIGYNFIYARLFSVTISIISILLIYLIGKEMLGKFRGLIASVLCLVMPGIASLWFTITIEPLGIMLVLIGLWLTSLYIKSNQLWAILIGGFCFGLAIMAKYTFAIPILGIVIALIVTNLRDYKRWYSVVGVIAGVVIISGYFLVVMPKEFIAQSALSQLNRMSSDGNMFLALPNLSYQLLMLLNYRWLIIPPITIVIAWFGHKYYDRTFLVIATLVSWGMMFVFTISAERFFPITIIMSVFLFVGALPELGLLRNRVSVRATISVALVFVVITSAYFDMTYKLYQGKAQIEYENDLFKQIVAKMDTSDYSSLNPSIAALSQNIKTLPQLDIFGDFGVLFIKDSIVTPARVDSYSELFLSDGVVKSTYLIIDVYSSVLFNSLLSKLYTRYKLVDTISPISYPKTYNTGYITVALSAESCSALVFDITCKED